MNNEYLWLLSSGALFVGTHLGIPSTRIRPLLVEKVGEKAYMGLYSLLSLALIIWFVNCYNTITGQIFIWQPNIILHALAVALMPFVLILLVYGQMTPNLSQAGGERYQGRGDLVQGIFRVTRHPVQWAFLLWAIVHILAAGDLAGLLLFSGIACVSLFGALLIDRRKAATLGQAWLQFQAATSNVPFAAIFQGRQRLVLAEFKPWMLALAIALYVLLWWGHSWLDLGAMLINPFV